MNEMQFRQLRAGVYAYAEGRSETDPTEHIEEPIRSELRATALDHLRRLEQTRVARVEAARHRAGYANDGELIPSGPQGSPVTARSVSGWPPRWGA